MPGRAASKLPAGDVESWLDLYPPTKSTSDTKSNSTPSPRKPAPKPKLVARINKVREILADLKITIDNRKFILKLHKHTSLYCAHCTPLGTPAACGPTCPLLRPENKPHNLPITRSWAQRAAADTAAYQEVVDDMDARGNDVHAATVGRWERAVEKLRVNGRTQTERHADEDWRQVPPMHDRVGFKRGWGFEEHWGKGAAVREEIAPDNPRRDSKRGFSIDEDFAKKRVKRT